MKSKTNFSKLKKMKNNYRTVLIEINIIAALSIIVFFLSAKFDMLEKVMEFTHKYESYEIDEIIITAVFLLFCLFIFSFRRILELRNTRIALHENNEHLKKIIEEMNTLKGIIPICSSCKKIRTDKGGWEQLEFYLRKYTDASFTHGICPECFEELYPELNELDTSHTE